MLEKLAAEQGNQIQAIEIEVPRELLAKRMVGRRKLSRFAARSITSISDPPKTIMFATCMPDVQLNHRSDDKAETVESASRYL